MAVKKATEAAGAAEEVQTVNNTTATENAANGANTGVKEAKEPVTLIYIGPKLPGGKLKSNKIFIGTPEEIKKELAPVLEEYPLVERLLVPVSQLAEKKDKVRTAGNILNKYYADVVSSIAAHEAKEA